MTKTRRDLPRDAENVRSRRGLAFGVRVLRAIGVFAGCLLGPTAIARAEDPPRTAAERTLAAIWGEVLRVRDVSRDANFFALGGDSIKASKILTRIRDVFEIRLPMEIAGQASTISDLAEIVDRALEVERTVILRVHQESGPHRGGS